MSTDTLRSIEGIAIELGQPVERVKLAARQLGITPAVVRQYALFDSTAVEQLRVFIDRQALEPGMTFSIPEDYNAR